jgi:hypothetical protein
MRTFHRWVGFSASLFLVIHLKMFSQRAQAGRQALFW